MIAKNLISYKVLLINPRMNLDYISEIKIPLKKPSYENLRTFLFLKYFSLHCVFHASICVQLSKEPKTSIAFGFSQLHFLHRYRYYTIMNMLEIKATILGEKRKRNQFFFMDMRSPTKDLFNPIF